MLRISGMQIMHTVPALLPVDARNTCEENQHVNIEHRLSLAHIDERERRLG